MSSALLRNRLDAVVTFWPLNTLDAGVYRLRLKISTAMSNTFGQVSQACSAASDKPSSLHLAYLESDVFSKLLIVEKALTIYLSR